jgi:ADP-glucose pyrophosphorylase
MNNVSIISYPSHRDNSLLSLTDLRSKYMLPFAGRLRVADFTLRNAQSCSAKKTLIFSDAHDDLVHYVQHHPLGRNDEQVTTKVYLETKLTIAQCARILFTKPTAWYILYNGDCPSIIDFDAIIKKAKAKKTAGPVLYLLDFDGRPSMSRIVLLCDRKSLQNFFSKAVKEKKQSPHIFEMIINNFILKNIKRENLQAYFRPLLSVPEYYHANFEAVRDKQISQLIFNDPHLRSGMNIIDHSYFALGSDVSSSYIGEGCNVYGTIHNSILFPGTFVEEKCVIRDSIILPYGRIGFSTRIERSIIDEFTDRSRTDIPRNISAFSFIGSGILGYKNADFPKALFDSITLIGKNCAMPEGMRIGSACYIESGTGNASFEKTKTVEDSLSIADTLYEYEHNNESE